MSDMTNVTKPFPDRWLPAMVISTAIAPTSVLATGVAMFDPSEITQILQYGGTTAVLILVALAFLRRMIVTSGELDKLESIYSKTIQQKDDEIDRMEQRILQLQADKDLLRELAYRNQGSQHTQAAAMREIAEAVVRAVGAQPPPFASGEITT